MPLSLELIRAKLGPLVKKPALTEAESYAADFIDGAYFGAGLPVGTTEEEFCSRKFIAEHRPGWLREEVVIDELVMPACAGGPKSPVNLKARSDLLAKVGPERYAAILREYGATATKNGTKPDNSREAISNNPWHPKFEGDRIKAQTSIISGLGTAKASQLAKAAGVTLGGTPLRS